MHKAMLAEPQEKGRVLCRLCAHNCLIRDGQVGVCHVRLNEGGALYTQVYGRLIARHVDPIEKKPLFHFQPGTLSYSVATVGCNFRCGWCQNAEISQLPREQGMIPGAAVSPEEIVAAARRQQCRSIAYTYTEPTIWFEYAHDIALPAREAGLANVFVTNGFMTPAALKIAATFLDAANVDLKAFREETYRRQIGARLAPVLETLQGMKRYGIWVEVTTMIVPGINDDEQELRDIARFLAAELGPETPWHISRFHPAHELMHVPATPLPTLVRAEEIGREEGLHHIYQGNISGEANTHCPGCGHLLLRRRGFDVRENHLRDGRCPECGRALAGVDL
jgi:pyruvate formate lyase activating enzyme